MAECQEADDVKCERRVLSGEAFEYLHSRCYMAGHLRDALRDVVVPGPFTAWTFVPSNVDTERVTRFEEGAAAWWCAEWAACTSVVEHARERLTDGIWVVPDVFSGPGDVPDEWIDAPYVVIDNEVWHIASEGENGIAAAWRDGTSAAGALGIVASGALLARAAQRDYAAAAAGAALVMVSAYDSNEKALFFERTDR